MNRCANNEHYDEVYAANNNNNNDNSDRTLTFCVEYVWERECEWVLCMNLYIHIKSNNLTKYYKYYHTQLLLLLLYLYILRQFIVLYPCIVYISMHWIQLNGHFAVPSHTPLPLFICLFPSTSQYAHVYKLHLLLTIYVSAKLAYTPTHQNSWVPFYLKFQINIHSPSL